MDEASQCTASFKHVIEERQAVAPANPRICILDVGGIPLECAGPSVSEDGLGRREAKGVEIGELRARIGKRHPVGPRTITRVKVYNVASIPPVERQGITGKDPHQRQVQPFRSVFKINVSQHLF